MKAKKLSVFIGDNALQFQNVNPKDGSPTPIVIDMEKRTAVIHFGEKDKMYVDLGKSNAFRIEEEQSILQS